MSFPNQTQKSVYETTTSHEDVMVNIKGNFRMEILICAIFWNTVSYWKIISTPHKIFMCYKTPTKGSFFFSFPLSWPIFGLFCHKVAVTCRATHNLLSRYISLTFVHFISGTKKMLSLGRSSTCRTLLCLHRFLTNLTWDTEALWTKV